VELLGDGALVEAVLRDFENSPLDDRHKALFRFVTKVNADSPNITQEDIETLHTAGWNDDAIFYAITVCALFNFYNRWIDATGVRPMSEEGHRVGGKRSAQHGYVR
jgi:uncharacterized peroxidase-related enzyme